ncbi:hypothetical protein BDV93DRAFT_574581 [Ceratobasidium sp. AG-I]|nr:hypothetical protein BDV93DRAFT_574581 [Ceratobasidium sp. AG-I]
MHLFLLNHGPGLLSLWTNTYDGVRGAGSENYLISADDWDAIGRETEAATDLIPAKFIRRLPNIKTSLGLYCAESWSFWLVHVGPIVLRKRLADKYYNHYLELVDILKVLLESENTVERMDELRGQVIGYVKRFEEYYYQYNYNRLSVCKLTLHALLHIPDEVIRCGPVWVSWSFSIERYCREITFCTLSKVVPYSTINRHVLHVAQISAISSKYPAVRKALLFGKSDGPVMTSCMEHVYPGYESTILRFPCLRQFPISSRVRKRLAAFFYTNNPYRTFREWKEFMPERCERWGKIRIDGGDNICSASARNPLSAYGKRDCSFVRYVYKKDKNESRRDLPIEMILAPGYGRLDYVLALELPANDSFRLRTPQLCVLAHITECQGATGDATSELVSYRRMGRSFVLDITSIENAVGRVETKGVIEGGEWVFIDRSNDAARTTFQCTNDGDQGYEEDD